MVDERIALETGRLTRAQRNAMISTYSGFCKACGGRTRVIKAVGCPWQWHRCHGREGARIELRERLAT